MKKIIQKTILLVYLLLITSIGFAQQYTLTQTSTLPFTDITTTGTALSLSDDGEANITSLFTIYLGGQGSKDLRISNNGAILFGATSGDVHYSNTPLSTSVPMIAPFWDDLYDGGNVYYLATSSVLTIQWERKHVNASTGTTAKFQVVFFAGSDNIYFRYDDVIFGNSAYDGGMSATIGLATSDEVFQFSFNTASVGNGDLIKYMPAKTDVPDDNFEYYLETHTAAGATVAIGAEDSMGDGNLDDKVITANINTVTILDVVNKNISDLTGVEDFIALTRLYCFQNTLTALNISTNTALTKLLCGNNDLTALDISANTALTKLSCYINDLTSLDVSANTALTDLSCYLNDLTSLDVSTNTALTKLSCSYNNLTTLDIRNGANNLLAGTYTSGSSTYARFKATNNPNLTCIFVDNATDANNGINDYLDWEIDAASTFVADQAACNIAFPPENDEATGAILIQVDVEGAGCTNPTTVQNDTGATSSAPTNGIPSCANYAGGDLWYKFIAPSSGNIKMLRSNAGDWGIIGYALYNSVTGNNSDIITCLTINTNQTESYTTTNLIAGNTYWLRIWEYNNNDFGAVNICLEEVRTTNIPDNNFEAYIETHNANGVTVALGAADSMGNGVLNDDTVPTSRIENVTLLNVQSKSISDLTGIEDFIALISLNCGSNDLTNLDISTNTALTYLHCSYNHLTALDVSTNMALTYLACYNNDLTTLDVRNIPVSQIPTVHFNALNNPNLTCIYTDDVSAAQTNWTNIDATAIFVADEAACTANINNLDLVGFKYYPNPVNNTLYLTAQENITQISIYNMLGQEVKNSTPSQLTTSIDMSNLSNGTYFIKAQVGKQTGTFKIIKK